MSNLTNIILLVLCATLTACDRPFQEVGAAEVAVLSPDVTQALDTDRVMLELEVTSVRDVSSVSAGSIEFANPSGDRWTAELDLNPGLNRFLIESVVEDSPTSVDTVDILHVTWEVESTTGRRPLLTGIGGHTASVTSNGDLVLIGGSVVPGGPGGFDAWTLRSGSDRFSPARGQSVAPRVGHSANMLPDDRILLVGGGDFGNIESTDQLIETAEIYDPETGFFTEIPVEGPPIRRMYHSSVLRNIGGELFLVVLGGRGDIRYTPEPELGIRRDMRTFQLRNDSLIARSPAIGPFILPVAGHTQEPLLTTSGAQPGQFLVTGIVLDESEEGTSLVVDFDAPAGIELSDWPAMNTPRIRHASVAFAPGHIAHFGGRPLENDTPLSSGEIHVESAERSFRFPQGLQNEIVPLFGSSSTLMPDGRIAFVGGFDAAGTGLPVVNFVSLRVQ